MNGVVGRGREAAGDWFQSCANELFWFAALPGLSAGDHVLVVHVGTFGSFIGVALGAGGVLYSPDCHGLLGWLTRGQTTPEFDRQIFRLHEGLTGMPVESRWGYHVVCIDAIERGRPLDFDEVRQQISGYLELQVRRRDLQQYLLGLKERYDVQGLAEIEAAAG